MWKAVLAGTTALAIAGSSLVYAQPRQGRPDGASRWRPNVEDMRAFGEARLAALKAGLTLTPEQEKNWPAFETAARELGKLRLDRFNTAMAQRGNDQPAAADPVERLRRRGTAMADTGNALKKLADATDPLYKSLDDGQKRRFAMLSRLNGRNMRGPSRDFRRREGDGSRSFESGPRRLDGSERGPRRTEFAPGGSEERL